MYDAKVIELFLASPSDVLDERNCLEEVIHGWNKINSKSKKIVLQPIRWEDNVHSDFSDRPQSVINKQILESADILIAIFHSRIGSPTENHESGTIEELKIHINAKKSTMVFFSNADIKQENINQEQLIRLKEFKSWCGKNGVYFEYNDQSNFKEKAKNQIGLLLNSPKFSSLMEAESKPPEMSDVKKDAIDFMQNLTNFQKDMNLVVPYIEKMGNYKIQKLKPFLKDNKIVQFEDIFGGGFSYGFLSNFSNFKQNDINLFIEDIIKGKYDRYFN
jgi:hypothetical protein